MNTNQLINFISAAQTLNFSATAKSSYISQPALTKQISRLESELGVTLFDRTKHGVSLTYAGEEFYKYAVDILDSIKQAENRMANISAGRTGYLRISSIYSMEKVISNSLSVFKEKYPDIVINMLIGTGTSQIMTIRKMTYDVFFSFANLLVSFPEMNFLPIKSDRFAVYIHSDQEEQFLAEGIPYLNKIKHFIETSSEGPFLTNQTFSIINTLKLSNDNIVYYPSSTAMLTAVQAGLGFTLLPLEMNHGVLPEGVSAVPLDIPEAVIKRAIGWHKDNKNSAVSCFIETLELE